MTAVLLSLGSAATFGAADFLGGLASRRAAVLHVALLSQAMGLLVILAAMPFISGTLTTAAIGWGLAAGFGGVIGLTTYFRALSTGAMGVTAPVAALVGAAVPVVVGIGLGERPAVTAAVGIVVGIAATVLVSRPTRGAVATADVDNRRGLVLAAAAGLLFGVFFVCLAQAPETSGLWPLVGARVMGLALLAPVVIVQRAARPDLGAVRIAGMSGLLDMTANVLFLLATRQGLLILTSVLTSLYPIAVVLLAWVVLKERLGRGQLAGIGLALGATALIAV